LSKIDLRKITSVKILNAIQIENLISLII